MAIEEFFGDGAGNAVALPVENTWVSGQPFDLRIADPCDLICRANASVLLADSIEVRAQMRDRQGGAGDWLVIPMPINRGTHIEWIDWVNRVTGALAQDSPFMLHVPGGYGGPQTGEVGHDIRLQARRIGGGATTEFYVEGERRYNRDSPSMLSALAGAAGAGSSGSGYMSAPFAVRAALIATGAFVYGDGPGNENRFEAGDANHLLIYVDKTLANNPTTVEFSVQASEDNGVTWRTIPQIDQIAAGDTIQQGMTIETAEIVGAAGSFLYSTPIYPGHLYQVGVLATGPLPTLAINCALAKL
jgi:hypothetical protein